MCGLDLKNHCSLSLSKSVDQFDITYKYCILLRYKTRLSANYIFKKFKGIQMVCQVSA